MKKPKKIIVVYCLFSVGEIITKKKREQNKMQQVVEQIIEDEQPRVKIMSMRAFLTDDTNLPDVIQPNRTYGIFIKVQTVPGSQVSYQIRVVNRNAKQDDEPLERSEVRELTGTCVKKVNVWSY